MFTSIWLSENELEVLETPPFLLNCNRTQQRYTAAMLAAQRYIQESQPIQQNFFLREDASRLLSLYRKTEDNTHYIFQEALTDLKLRLSIARLEELLYVLPRKRPGTKRNKLSANAVASAGHQSAGTALDPATLLTSYGGANLPDTLTAEEQSAVTRLLTLGQSSRPDPLRKPAEGGGHYNALKMPDGDGRPDPLRPMIGTVTAPGEESTEDWSTKADVSLLLNLQSQAMGQSVESMIAEANIVPASMGGIAIPSAAMATSAGIAIPSSIAQPNQSAPVTEETELRDSPSKRLPALINQESQGGEMETSTSAQADPQSQEETDAE